MFIKHPRASRTLIENSSSTPFRYLITLRRSLPSEFLFIHGKEMKETTRHLKVERGNWNIKCSWGRKSRREHFTGRSQLPMKSSLHHINCTSVSWRISVKINNGKWFARELKWLFEEFHWLKNPPARLRASKVDSQKINKLKKIRAKVLLRVEQWDSYERATAIAGTSVRCCDVVMITLWTVLIRSDNKTSQFTFSIVQFLSPIKPQLRNRNLARIST